MNPEEEPILINPDAAAELWAAFDGSESQPAESEGNDHRGIERPVGRVPFRPEDEDEQPSQN
jgi:hypothetical protein